MDRQVAGLTPSGVLSNHSRRGIDMSMHYFAIMVPEAEGGWSALFPDLPGCATQGETVQEAKWMAAEAATLHISTMRENGDHVSAPRDLEAIRADATWSEEFQIDWSKVVISIIKVEIPS